ncbi:MAG: histidine phosphatase family protein [Spirochaetota bacterium]
MKFFFMRHCQSTANEEGILASQLDYPLSDLGHRQAEHIAGRFYEAFGEDAVRRILCSPLLRARETADPFERLYSVSAENSRLLVEQHLGRYSGLSYEQLVNEPGYEQNRANRWEWVPEGGGESYQMVAERLREFFLLDHVPGTLCITHAVTMRMIYAVLSATLPGYPLWIPDNGDMWEVDIGKLGQEHEIIVHKLGDQLISESRA